MGRGWEDGHQHEGTWHVPVRKVAVQGRVQGLCDLTHVTQECQGVSVFVRSPYLACRSTRHVGVKNWLPAYWLPGSAGEWARVGGPPGGHQGIWGLLDMQLDSQCGICCLVGLQPSFYCGLKGLVGGALCVGPLHKQATGRHRVRAPNVVTHGSGMARPCDRAGLGMAPLGPYDST